MWRGTLLSAKNLRKEVTRSLEMDSQMVWVGHGFSRDARAI